MVILDERRNNVTTHRTRLINELHALLRNLIPGGADRNLTAAVATKLLAVVRVSGTVETAPKQLCRDLISEIKDTDKRLKLLTIRIAETVVEHGTTLTAVDGIGPIIAARLVGRTRTAGRFPTASAFANYAGVAPIEVVSAELSRAARRLCCSSTGLPSHPVRNHSSTSPPSTDARDAKPDAPTSGWTNRSGCW